MKMVKVSAKRIMPGRRAKVVNDTGKVATSTKKGQVTQKSVTSTKTAQVLPKVATSVNKTKGTPTVAKSTNKAKPTPNVAVPTKKAKLTPEVAVPANQAKLTPNVAVPKKKGKLTANEAVPTKQAKLTPNEAVPKKKGKLTPEVAGPTKQAKLTPNVAVPKKKGKLTPHEDVPIKKGKLTPTVAVPTKKAKLTPNEDVPNKKGKLTPTVGVPTKKAKLTPKVSELGSAGPQRRSMVVTAFQTVRSLAHGKSPTGKWTKPRVPARMTRSVQANVNVKLDGTSELKNGKMEKMEKVAVPEVELGPKPNRPLLRLRSGIAARAKENGVANKTNDSSVAGGRVELKTPTFRLRVRPGKTDGTGKVPELTGSEKSVKVDDEIQAKWHQARLRPRTPVVIGLTPEQLQGKGEKGAGGSGYVTTRLRARPNSFKLSKNGVGPL